MKKITNRFTPPAALLLAAAAFPLNPLAAQEAQPPAQPTAQQPVDVAPPPAPPVQAERAAPPPAEDTPADPPAARAPAPRSAPARTVAPRAAPARPTPVRAAPAPRAATPAPVAVARAAPTAPPAAATVSPDAAPAPIAAAPPGGIDTAPAPTTRQQPALDQRTAVWPWFLLGALLIGAAALLFARRRRTRSDVYEDTYEPVNVEPVAEPVPVAPVAVAPVAAAAPLAPVAAEPAQEPEIALTMRPVRAGVAGQDARVEFELTVGNGGAVAARDVRVSTWMLAAGATETEQALIERRDPVGTPPVTIEAGEARTLEAQVALPTSEIEGDSVLPVVVADARYVLSDGSEGHARARFAVGVPDGQELAHFSVDSPSGLHEGVVAHTLGETERR